jgi:hypothetical protein
MNMIDLADEAVAAAIQAILLADPEQGRRYVVAQAE